MKVITLFNYHHWMRFHCLFIKAWDFWNPPSLPWCWNSGTIDSGRNGCWLCRANESETKCKSHNESWSATVCWFNYWFASSLWLKEKDRFINAILFEYHYAFFFLFSILKLIKTISRLIAARIAVITNTSGYEKWPAITEPSIGPMILPMAWKDCM